MTTGRAFWLIVAVVVGTVAAVLHLWWTLAGMVIVVLNTLHAVWRTRRSRIRCPTESQLLTGSTATRPTSQ